jgi:hypothetical protein
VRTVLDDPAYREHARQMRYEVCALPPVAAAVTALERVVMSTPGRGKPDETVLRVSASRKASRHYHESRAVRHAKEYAPLTETHC